MTNKTILVTGGAGYIGSQTVKELHEAGFTPVVFDNLSTGHREAVEGIKKAESVDEIEIIEGDLKNKDKIDKAIKKCSPEAVIHFAAFIEVGDSVKSPDKYFQNNIVSGLNLLDSMRNNNVNKIIFSSSAATYGQPKDNPITESTPQKPMNPYGLTKLMFEQILDSYKTAYGLKSISLRYFNAAGADPSGEIGLANLQSSLLIPRVLLTILGRYPEIKIFGTDYDTPDGTCVRDYIHVKDLANAHILALNALDGEKYSPAYNLGTGSGYSVKEVIEMAKKVTGKDFKVTIAPKRKGDPAKLIASNDLAKKELGFSPKYSDLETIVKTAWKWHSNNPEGYKSEILNPKSETISNK